MVLIDGSGSKDEAVGDRCMKILRMFFIDSLSTIEFCVKSTISYFPQSSLYKIFENNNALPLSEIIRNSKLNNTADYQQWMLLITIRNQIVHNNSIAKLDMNYNLNGRVIQMENGKMMRDQPDFFIFLTLSLVDLYYNWVDNLIENNIQ